MNFTVHHKKPTFKNISKSNSSSRKVRFVKLKCSNFWLIKNLFNIGFAGIY